jgi:hypothetical protein
MTEPYKTVFDMPGFGKLTSVVMDQADFNELCDTFTGIYDVAVKKRIAEERIADAKAAKIIPMISRGVKTQYIFDKYGIETDKASFIVRGHGKILAKNMGLFNE